MRIKTFEAIIKLIGALTDGMDYISKDELCTICGVDDNRSVYKNIKWCIDVLEKHAQGQFNDVVESLRRLLPVE